MKNSVNVILVLLVLILLVLLFREQITSGVSWIASYFRER